MNNDIIKLLNLEQFNLQIEKFRKISYSVNKDVPNIGHI